MAPPGARRWNPVLRSLVVLVVVVVFVLHAHVYWQVPDDLDLDRKFAGSVSGNLAGSHVGSHAERSAGGTQWPAVH